ncbi:MAG: hypothetical protein AAB421_03975 [Patescibacteria group bacterium]
MKTKGPLVALALTAIVFSGAPVAYATEVSATGSADVEIHTPKGIRGIFKGFREDVREDRKEMHDEFQDDREDNRRDHQSDRAEFRADLKVKLDTASSSDARKNIRKEAKDERKEMHDEDKREDREMRNDHKEQRKEFKNEVMGFFKNHLGLMSGRIDAAIEHSNKLVARVASRIEKASTTGASTTESVRLLADARVDIAAAVTADTALDALIATGATSTPEYITKVRSSVKSIMDSLKEAKVSLKAAIRILGGHKDN